MTLLEMTVVILVLLILISVLFFGAKAWKRGSDRAMCIVQIRSVQQALRSFSNMHGYGPSENATGLKGQLIGLGRFVETTPQCPGNGTYGYGQTYGPDTIPPIGELYMTCDLSSTQQHEPETHAEW